jgi:drug/metabolite transporter (DMT)-like permease
MSLRTDSAPRSAEVDPASAVRGPIRARHLATGTVAMCLLGASVGVSRTLTTAPLFTAQALRYVVAGLVLVAVAKRAGVRLVRPRGTEWLWLTGIAAVGLVLFNVAIVRGLGHAEPAVIAVAVACVPIVLGVIGPLLERRVPSRRILIAAATVTAGSALVEGTGRTDAIGLAWAAVVLACEACFTLLAVPVLPRHTAWGVSVHSVWIGAVMFAVLGCATEGPGSVARITASQWAALGYLALMVTAVAFICWYSTVAALGPGAAGVLTGIAPVAAALTGFGLDGRAPALSVWCGMLVVFCGLAVGLAGGRAITRVPRRRARPS